LLLPALLYVWQITELGRAYFTLNCHFQIKFTTSEL
jgi:hypothetical protein